MGNGQIKREKNNLQKDKQIQEEQHINISTFEQNYNSQQQSNIKNTEKQIPDIDNAHIDQNIGSIEQINNDDQIKFPKLEFQNKVLNLDDIKKNKVDSKKQEFFEKEDRTFHNQKNYHTKAINRSKTQPINKPNSEEKQYTEQIKNSYKQITQNKPEQNVKEKQFIRQPQLQVHNILSPNKNRFDDAVSELTCQKFITQKEPQKINLQLIEGSIKVESISKENSPTNKQLSFQLNQYKENYNIAQTNEKLQESQIKFISFQVASQLIDSVPKINKGKKKLTTDENKTIFYVQEKFAKFDQDQKQKKNNELQQEGMEKSIITYEIE